MKNILPAFLSGTAAFITYIALSAGSASESNSILLWSVPEIIIGLFLSIITGLLCRRVWMSKKYTMANPLRLLLLVIYIVPFLIELTIANLTVAFKIITGKNIRPGIVKLSPGLKTHLGTMLLSATITFQPGTAAVDADDNTNELYIHVLDTGAAPKEKLEPDEIFSKIKLAKWIRRITE